MLVIAENNNSISMSRYYTEKMQGNSDLNLPQ